MTAHTPWTRARQVLNAVNGSTLLGLAVARVGGAQVQRLHRGVLLAPGYRLGFPAAAAFTIGNVVVSRHSAEYLRARPALLAHEERHCSQYAVCLGPMMIPLYALAAGLSLVARGDRASLNPFERLAGLADGGYRP